MDDKRILLIGNASNDGSIDYNPIIAQYKHVVRFNTAPTEENFMKYPHMGNTYTHYFNNCWGGSVMLKNIRKGTKIVFTLPTDGPWVNTRSNWVDVAKRDGHSPDDCYQLTKADVEIMRDKYGLKKNPTSGLIAAIYFVERGYIPVLLNLNTLPTGKHYFDNVGITYHDLKAEKVVWDRMIAEGKILFALEKT